MNKRGSVVDLIYLAVIVAILVITIIFGSLIWEKVNTGVQGSMSAETYQKVEHMRTSVTASFDYIIPVVTIFTGIGIVILAKYINAHPIWYAFALLIIIFGIFINTIIQDVTESIVGTNADIYGTYQKFKLTQWIVEHGNYILLGFGILTLIVMYGTRGGGLSAV